MLYARCGVLIRVSLASRLSGVRMLFVAGLGRWACRVLMVYTAAVCSSPYPVSLFPACSAVPVWISHETC